MRISRKSGGQYQSGGHLCAQATPASFRPRPDPHWSPLLESPLFLGCQAVICSSPLRALPLPCRPRPSSRQRARRRGTGPIIPSRGMGGCPSNLHEVPKFSTSVTTRSCSTAPRPGRATPHTGSAPPAPPEPSVTASFSEGLACPGSLGRDGHRPGGDHPLPQQPRLRLWEAVFRDHGRGVGAVPGLRMSCRHRLHGDTEPVCGL